MTEPPDLLPGADGLLRGQPSLLSESEAWGWNPACSSSFSLQLWLACLHPQDPPKAPLLPGHSQAPSLRLLAGSSFSPFPAAPSASVIHSTSSHSTSSHQMLTGTT